MPRFLIGVPRGRFTQPDLDRVAEKIQVNAAPELSFKGMELSPNHIDVMFLEYLPGSRVSAVLIGTIEGYPHETREGDELDHRMSQLVKAIQKDCSWAHRNPRTLTEEFIDLNFAERTQAGWKSA